MPQLATGHDPEPVSSTSYPHNVTYKLKNKVCISIKLSITTKKSFPYSYAPCKLKLRNRNFCDISLEISNTPELCRYIYFTLLYTANEL